MTELTIPREMLSEALNGNARVVRFFEDQAQIVAETQEITTSSLTATGAIQDATVVTLSPNDSFKNERVLAAGNGIELVVNDVNVTIRVTRSVVIANGGFSLTATLQGDSALAFPLEGIVATRENVETLKGKTLDKPSLSSLGNHANDAAAAAGGVPIGGIYHNAGALRVRLV